MFSRKNFFLISLICLSTQATAGVFTQAGLHFGGDSLASATFTSGSSESIHAGGLISGSLGYEADIGDTLLVKLSAGIKLDAITATNGNVDFTRFPLNAMIFKKGEKFHFGIGITQHTGVELSGDGLASFSTVEFDDATGLILQVDYLLNERAYMSLKLTSIDYQQINSNVDIDGSSLGILIGYRFGKK
jgi:Outer membrane protein beta-barrel domain